MYQEIIRILRPGGRFCLDTPNRLFTAIHVAGPQWIHPEDKIEYAKSTMVMRIYFL